MISGNTLKIKSLVVMPYSLTPKAQANDHFKQEKERDLKEVFARRHINPFPGFFDPISPMEIYRNTHTLTGYHETFHKHGRIESFRTPMSP